jgi:hypothetical protein
MMHHSSFLVFAVLLGSLAGCNSGPHSAAGFRLPEDGDAVRGKATFIARQCHDCHEVTGVELPQPAIPPPVMVVLGGELDRPMTDGYLVTSIMNPSFKLARYPQNEITLDGRSRMPQHENLTVRELTDIVAFLQTRYFVRTPPPKYLYH